MDSAVTFRYPFEVFHYIGNVGLLTINTSLNKGAIEQLPRRTNERFPNPILLIAGLFANEHDLRMTPAFTENGLGANLPKITRLAPRCRRADTCKSQFFRKKSGG